METIQNFFSFGMLLFMAIGLTSCCHRPMSAGEPSAWNRYAV